MAVEPEAGHGAGSRMNVPARRSSSESPGAPGRVAGCFSVTKAGNTIELKYMKGREKVTFCVTPIQQRWRTNGLAIRVWCQHGKTAEEVTVWGQQDAEFRFRATELECLSRHPGAPAQWARNTGSHQGFLADTLIPDLQPPELGDSNFIALSHPSF